MKSPLLLVIWLSLFFGSASTRTTAPTLTGTWRGAIDRPGNSYGPLSLTLTFKQEGEKLTGTYRDDIRKEPQAITGTVKGNAVTFQYELKPPPEVKKPGLIVTFNGTLTTPTKITGTIRNPYCQGDCKWELTRQGK